MSKANDIRDFEIEGMAIGDSLLDHFSKDIIKDSIVIGPYDHIKKKWEKKLELIFNEKKKGQIQSIVDTYSKINTPYIFHCEDDWVYTRKNFIEDSLKILKTDDVACIIDAKHMCVNSRGIRHIDCSTVTGEFGGKFKDKLTKREFLDYIRTES